MGKRRGQGSGREDQFGEFGSQDRDERFQFSHKSSSGGGSAGGSRRGAAGELSFQKHVPKFLQKYSHLLGGGKGSRQNEDDPVMNGQIQAEDPEDDAYEEENIEAVRDRSCKVSCIHAFN